MDNRSPDSVPEAFRQRLLHEHGELLNKLSPAQKSESVFVWGGQEYSPQRIQDELVADNDFAKSYAKMMYDSQNLLLRGELHKPLTIKLNSSAASGYQWQPQFDSSAIKLLRRRHLRAKANRFGASGSEEFSFEPIKTGVHDIKFELTRPFETKPIETKVFSLAI